MPDNANSGAEGDIPNQTYLTAKIGFMSSARVPLG